MVDSARCLVSGNGADGQGGVRGSLVKGWVVVDHNEIMKMQWVIPGPG